MIFLPAVQAVNIAIRDDWKRTSSRWNEIFSSFWETKIYFKAPEKFFRVSTHNSVVKCKLQSTSIQMAWSKNSDRRMRNVFENSTNYIHTKRTRLAISMQSTCPMPLYISENVLAVAASHSAHMPIAHTHYLIYNNIQLIQTRRCKGKKSVQCARAVIRSCFSLAVYPSLWRWRVALPNNHITKKRVLQ